MNAAKPCSLRGGPSTQAPQGLSPGVMSAIGKVQKAIRKAMMESGESGQCLPSLAEAIAGSSFLVTLRTGLPLGCESPDYLSTLRHSFLIVQDGPSSDMCIVVDPNFREQFTCTSMPASSVYAQTVANNVPQFFVGTIGTINALVCLLQSTLAEEAQALGLELPPWRSRSALLSKWLPRRFTDSVFMPPALEANLHPLLKSSLAAGRCSSAGAGASASGERASPSRTLQPQTVVQQAQEPAAQPQQQGPQPGVASAQQQGPDPSVAAAPQQAPLRLQQQDDALAKLEVGWRCGLLRRWDLVFPVLTVFDRPGQTVPGEGFHEWPLFDIFKIPLGRLGGSWERYLEGAAAH
eukprot:XP_001692573.1 predicted protein [Chlamydomonas reinhardtii]